MFSLRHESFSGVVISMLVHATLLLAMSLYTLNRFERRAEIELETVFETVQQQEELNQALESTDFAPEARGVSVSGNFGFGSGAEVAPQPPTVRIEVSERADAPQIDIAIGEETVYSRSEIALDLGERQVSGEVAAAVQGYDAALSRMTSELIRLLRDKPLLVAWLFDESDSMTDDQAEIRANFDKVYQELDALAGQESRRKQSVMTVVAAFGQQLHYLTAGPTDEVKEIRAAIDRIPVDRSGTENTFQAIGSLFEDFGPKARSQRRKLVLIVVSDESGDDSANVEQALEKARQAEAVVYFFGREAVFGYPYARVKWKDPKYGLTHWLRIRRGPETAMPEALQWNGFRARWDSFSAGFGPYEQVRLAKETGGVFFLLPSEERALAGPGSRQKRIFDFLDMKQYQPHLVSRAQYERRRNASPFRKTIWDVIVRLNPHLDEQLNIRFYNYSIRPQDFRRQGAQEFGKAVRALRLANQAVQLLESIAPLRSAEESRRWRASYDLLFAQVLAYRVRLFQFLLAMDQHAKSGRMPENSKTNEWDIHHTKRIRPPDPQQVQATGVDPEELSRQQKDAIRLFEKVIQEHPGTPWAQRAEFELSQGFGIEFVEDYRDPNYNRIGTEIKLPRF